MLARLSNKLADEPPDSGVRARQAILLIQAALLIAALTLFYLALDRPAWFDYEGLGWGGTPAPPSPADKPLTGWECLGLAFFFWPSNALLLLSPLVALALSRARRPIAFIIVAVLYLISAGWVALSLSKVYMIGRLPGYVLWLCAHALVTLAILLPTWRGGRPPLRAYRGGGFPVVVDGGRTT